MAKNFLKPIENLAQSRSLINFDPRARILALFFLIIACCGIFDLKVLSGLCFLGLISVIFSGLGAREIFLRLLPANIFILLIWLITPLAAGPPYWSSSFLPDLSLPGLWRAALITLKANAIVLFSTSLISTEELSRLAVGLHFFKVPIKIIWLLLLTYRYVIGLSSHISRSVMAIKLRSAGSHKKISYWAYAGLFARTFVKAAHQGDRLGLAMRARGFGANLALRRLLCWRLVDTILLFTSLAVTIIGFLLI